MNNLLSIEEKLNIKVDNLYLVIRRKNDELNKKKDEIKKLKKLHIENVVKLKQKFTKQMLDLRLKKREGVIVDSLDVLFDIIHLITEVSKEDILSRCRKRDIIVGRQIVCYILRDSGKSLKDIGFKLKGLHHSTVIHSIRQVQEWINNPTYYKKEYNIYNKVKNNFDDLEI
jgi:chromosomal replication initiation ATPase DnaA